VGNRARSARKAKTSLQSVSKLCRQYGTFRISQTYRPDDGKAVNATHRPRSTPQKHYFSAFGTRFC
jgi:hypothetical protein